MADKPNGGVTLSRGAMVLFGALFSVMTFIGGFGLYEQRAIRSDLSAARTEIQTIARDQAVMSERLDNTRRLEIEINNLRDDVSELRVQLAVIQGAE